jgi:hypothetical protein
VDRQRDDDVTDRPPDGSCRELFGRGTSSGTDCHLQALGPDDLGVARIEWQYLVAALVAASTCCLVRLADPHSMHVSHPATGSIGLTVLSTAIPVVGGVPTTGIGSRSAQ